MAHRPFRLRARDGHRWCGLVACAGDMAASARRPIVPVPAASIARRPFADPYWALR
jgi:hypothetical protein